MIKVKITDNNLASFEKAMKIFKKLCQADGFMLELRDRKYYKKPSVRKREKKLEAIRKEKIKKK